MKVNRRELLFVLAVMVIAWVGLLLAVAKWQSGRDQEGAVTEPELPHFPGTEMVEEQTSQNLGWRKYWFRFDENYPSKSVFYFYRDQLGSKGWRRVPETEPAWVRRRQGDVVNDIFHSTWISPDHLYQIDLDMVSTLELEQQDGTIVRDEREPGMKVYVTLRRVMAPGMLLPPQSPEPRRGEIEVH